jgi:peptidoglycan/LPS O-acetylase OafA/YrhL
MLNSIKRLLLDNIVPLLAAIMVTIFVVYSYTNFIHKTVGRVVISAVLPTNVTVIVKSLDKHDKLRPYDQFDVISNKSSQPQLMGTKRLNKPIGKLQLEFVSTDNTAILPEGSDIVVHSIKVEKPYDDNIFISSTALRDFFKEAPNSSASAIPIANVQGFKSLLSIQTLGNPALPKTLAIGALFFLAMLFLFRHVEWSKIPAFSDMSLGREISSSHEFGTINGLRGIAALLVLFSHTAPGFEANGVGIAILFVISGFLLSKPFIVDSNRVFSWANVERYFVKRIKRILPMYYLYIFLLYIVPMKLETALRHFLFVQAEGHLWPMTQIFAFYMLLPIILLLTSGLYRLNRVLPVIALTIGAYLSLKYMGGWMPFYNGDYYHSFFLYSFLFGVTAAYIQYDLVAKNSFLLNLFQDYRQIFAVLGFTVLVLTVLWTGPIKAPIAFIFHYLTQFYVKCLLCVAIILLAVNTHKTWFNAIISNWLFRSVGVIGFSFYILHGLGMHIVLKTQIQLFGNTNPSDRSWSFMFFAFLVTYCLSVLSYSFIERPFFGFKKTKPNKATQNKD